METILEFQNVSYAYHTLDGETPALSHISFSVKKENLLLSSVHLAAENPHSYH